MSAAGKVITCYHIVTCNEVSNVDTYSCVFESLVAASQYFLMKFEDES